MTTRISFIGGGRMASFHAAALQKIDGVEVYGIYDIDPVKSKIFAEKFHVTHQYSSRAELLADRAADAVAVCDYGHQHADELLALMDAGVKYAFCEKPAIRQTPEAAPVLEAARRTGCRVCIGHVRRYFPEQLKMKELMDSGAAGKILFAKAHCCVSGYSRVWGDYFASYEQSGGAALDMGSHYADVFNWFFGRAVRADGTAFGLERRLTRSQKPCDYCAGSILYENGVVCGLDVSYQRYGEPAASIEVYGDRGTLIASGGKLKLHTPDAVTEYHLPEVDVHVRQMTAFVDMIRTGGRCACMLEDGIAAAEVILDMLRASESKSGAER